MHAVSPKTPGVNPTQESSARRVKTNKMDINGVYLRYSTEASNPEVFRKTCKDAIMSSAGKGTTKMMFMNKLSMTNRTDKMLFIVNNYFMSGEGLKV